METENSEVYKMIYEGTEVYLNGEFIGNGEVVYEVETPYEKVHSGDWAPNLRASPAKRTFKITMPEGSHPLRGDWIIKWRTPSGDSKEETFSSQEEARRAMKIFRDFGIKGHFELVCRPRVEDVVVTSYRNEPEDEPPPKSKEEDDEFDLEKTYRDSTGDIWTYLSGQSGRGPGWYYQEEEGEPRYGPFDAPLVGPHEEVVDEEAIIDPRDLLKSKQYLDRYGCVWKYRIHQGDEMPYWHYRVKGERDWDPFRFSAPVDGPWTEYKGED